MDENKTGPSPQFEKQFDMNVQLVINHYAVQLSSTHVKYIILHIKKKRFIMKSKFHETSFAFF